jgi:hypothetical protein
MTCPVLSRTHLLPTSLLSAMTSLQRQTPNERLSPYCALMARQAVLPIEYLISKGRPTWAHQVA